MKKIDPITMEVLSNGVLSICEEMGVVLSGTARSTNLRESGDFSCTLHDSIGQLVAQTNTLPALASLARTAVFELQSKIDINDISPGDIFFTNHMDIGGSHLSDVKAISPVFYNSKIVAWVANCAHWTDIGGAYPGGYVCATHLFQEGLIIPPVKLYNKGKIDQQLVDFILNNVRGSEERLGDIRAQVASINRGINRITEFINKYNLETINVFFVEYLNYVENLVKNEIKNLPNGKYQFEDYMDNDGINDDLIKIKVLVEILNEKIVFDFTGSDKQVLGPINATPAVVWAGVNFAVRGVTNPHIPINDGVYRPLELIIPKGSWLNAEHPSPRQHCTHETGHRVIDCVLGAFSKAVPKKVPAAMHGTSSIMVITGDSPQVEIPDTYMFFECLAGGFGARPDKDGIDGIRTGVGNAINMPAELVEAEFGLITDKYELIIDSGGPGKYRGGCGMKRIMRLPVVENIEAMCISSAERCVTSPYGLYGGKPGNKGSWYKNINKNNEEKLKGKNNIKINGGETYAACSPGGGGWGNPLERNPNLVMEDFLNEKISLRGAKNDYGIIFKNKNKEIDWDKTKELRKLKNINNKI